MDDIEKKILELYKTGERNPSKYYDFIGKKCRSVNRVKILMGIIKKLGLKMFILSTKPQPNKRQKLFIKTYMDGKRDMFDFISTPGLENLTYDDVLNYKDKMGYYDIKIHSYEDFYEFKHKDAARRKWCKWVFETPDDKEYTSEQLDQIFNKFFNHIPSIKQEIDDPNNVLGWLESYHKYFSLDGMDEVKLRKIFQRHYDVYWSDTKRYKQLLGAFHSFLPEFIKSHGVKDFKFYKDMKKESKTDTEDDYDPQEDGFFDLGEEFE